MSITNTVAPQDNNYSYNKYPQQRCHLLLKLMDKTDESRKLVQKASIRAMCLESEIAFLEQQLAMFAPSPQTQPLHEVKTVSRRTTSDLDISKRSRAKSISFDVSVSSPKKNLVRADSNDSRQSLDSGRASPMQPFTNHYAKELNFYCEDDCKSTSVASKRYRSESFDVSSSSRRCLDCSLHNSQDYSCLNQTREPCNNTNEEVIRSSPSKRHRSHTFDVSNSSRETRGAGYDFHHCSSCSGKRCVSIDHLNSSPHSDFIVNETKSRLCTSSNLPIPVDRFCAEERSITAFSNTGSYNNLFSTNEESYEPYFGLEVLDDDELSLLSFTTAL